MGELTARRFKGWRRWSSPRLSAYGLAAVLALVSCDPVASQCAPVPPAPPPAPAPPPPTPGPVPPPESFATVPSNFDRAPWILPGDGIPRSTPEGGGIGIGCEHSHLGYDDPIVYPGVRGASHLHNFAGNTATNADSTYRSLRSTGSGTCSGGPLDRTGYWIPAMHNGQGRVVIPSFFEVYYTGSGTQQEIQSIQTYPNGLRMIAGFDMAEPNTIRAEWECLGPGQSPYGPKMATIPTDCPAGHEVRASIRFPMCWNGQNVDSANHRSHMAYGTGGGGFITTQRACPASHPIHLPEIKLFSNYVSDGNTATWYLASDRMPGMTHPAGSTYHADWFGAWDNQIQELWTQECIRETRHCEFGQLGDGTRLRNDVALYNGPMVVDPPPRP